MARKPIYAVDDETLVLADQAEKAIWQIREGVREFLADTMAPEKADELARLMSEGTWTHDHPISFKQAKLMGLPVTSDVPKEVLELMEFFPNRFGSSQRWSICRCPANLTTPAEPPGSLRSRYEAIYPG